MYFEGRASRNVMLREEPKLTARVLPGQLEGRCYQLTLIRLQAEPILVKLVSLALDMVSGDAE